MKFVFFSDLHGNLYAWQAFSRQMESVRPDAMYFLGDVFGYYYYHHEIMSEFRSMGVACLLGNHDRNFLDAAAGKVDPQPLAQKYGSVYLSGTSSPDKADIAFLNGLYSSLFLHADGLRLGLFHGTPAQPLDGRLYPDTPVTDPAPYEPFDFVILGHTHHKMVRRVGRATVLNPGSLGQQRDGRGCSYLLFDTALRAWSFCTVAYDVQRLIDDVARYDGASERLTEVLLRRKE